MTDPTRTQNPPADAATGTFDSGTVPPANSDAVGKQYRRGAESPESVRSASGCGTRSCSGRDRTIRRGSRPGRVAAGVRVRAGTGPSSLREFVLRLLGAESADPFASAQVALAELKTAQDRKPPTNPWAWLTVGLSATLGVLVAGWLLVRIADGRIVDQIRATEVELDRGLGELSEAVKEIDAARAIDLHGKADAAARLDAARAFTDAMKRYNSAKTRIDDARRGRANLLDRLVK